MFINAHLLGPGRGGSLLALGDGTPQRLLPVACGHRWPDSASQSVRPLGPRQAQLPAESGKSASQIRLARLHS